MKKLILITSLTISSIFSFCQTLQLGVYSSIILYSDTFVGHPVTSCYNYEYDFSNNCLPYVTGMHLVLKIDTIKGAVDSIQIWRWPDFVNLYLKTNDTIPLTNNLNDIYIYFLGHDTLYTSIIAYGTPQIANEYYFCNFSKSMFMWVDGCNNFAAQIAGGDGPLDDVKDCSILINSIGISDKEQFCFEVYPNPAKDILNLNIPSNISDKEIRIYNLLGETKKYSIAKNNNIDISGLSDGVYFIEISSCNKFFRTKFVKK